GGVVGVHDVEDVRGAGGVQPGHHLDADVLRQLLDDVRETLVGQLAGQLDAPLGRELVDDLGEVRRVQVLVRGGQQVRGLLRLGAVQPGDLGQLDGEGHAAADEPAQGGAPAPTAQVQAGDVPVPVAVLVQRDVQHRRLAAAVVQGHRPVQQLADHQQLAGALLEAAHVEHPGGDHLAGGDRG